MVKRHLQSLTKWSWMLPCAGRNKRQNPVCEPNLTIQIFSKVNPAFPREQFLSPKMTCSYKQLPNTMQRQRLRKGIRSATGQKPPSRNLMSKGTASQLPNTHYAVMEKSQDNLSIRMQYKQQFKICPSLELLFQGTHWIMQQNKSYIFYEEEIWKETKKFKLEIKEKMLM